MSFINTKVTPEMVNKYDMQQDYATLKKHRTKEFFTYGQEEFWGANSAVYSNLEVGEFSKFIIDEQQDCYLRYGGHGGQIAGIFPHTYFLIYYKGQRIYFVIDTEIQGRDADNKISTSKVTILQLNSMQSIEIDTQLCETIATVIKLFELSWSGNWTHITTFNFDPIV